MQQRWAGLEIHFDSRRVLKGHGQVTQIIIIIIMIFIYYRTLIPPHLIRYCLAIDFDLPHWISPEILYLQSRNFPPFFSVTFTFILMKNCTFSPFILEYIYFHDLYYYRTRENGNSSGKEIISTFCVGSLYFLSDQLWKYFTFLEKSGFAGFALAEISFKILS